MPKPAAFELSEEERDLVVRMLALIYDKAYKILIKIRSVPAEDVFNHRVRSASGRLSVTECVAKLCNYWGLQSAGDEAVEIAVGLNGRSDAVLRALYEDHIVICGQATMLAKSWRETRKHARDNREQSPRNDRAADPGLSLWDGEDGLDAHAPADVPVGS